mmetsp:Transcript_31092/g.29675  ORF Transcript_31092/g.29675 Transcript_31092/m.29675 type:complete len:82 (+) Transcript_31092:1095-1340(+)
MDLQAMMMFHSSVFASVFTAAKPIPRFAPVIMTVLFMDVFKAASMHTLKEKIRTKTVEKRCTILYSKFQNSNCRLCFSTTY